MQPWGRRPHSPLGMSQLKRQGQPTPLIKGILYSRPIFMRRFCCRCYRFALCLFLEKGQEGLASTLVSCNTTQHLFGAASPFCLFGEFLDTPARRLRRLRFSACAGRRSFAEMTACWAVKTGCRAQSSSAGTAALRGGATTESRHPRGPVRSASRRGRRTLSPPSSPPLSGRRSRPTGCPRP